MNLFQRLSRWIGLEPTADLVARGQRSEDDLRDVTQQTRLTAAQVVRSARRDVVAAQAAARAAAEAMQTVARVTNDRDAP